MAIPLKLQVFEGPMDLLMHLIEKNKIDIYDIPIVTITDQYLEYMRQMEHYDELVDIYIEEGEKAMYKKLYNDLIPIVIGKMHEQIEKGGTSEEKTVLTFSKVDKAWIVIALEENRPSAAEAVSEQEAAAAADTSVESAAQESTASEYSAEGNTSAEYAGTASTAAEYASEEESRE